MNPARRAALQALLSAPVAVAAADDHADRVAPRELVFPRDHGAHQGTRIEWWYATGWLREAPDAPPLGWQITFFRNRTGLAAELPGRFAPRQLLFAHAAVTDVAGGRHHHAQRLARWSGDPAQVEAHASPQDTDVVLGPWRFRRAPDGRYGARLPAPEAGFGLALALAPTQPLLLQGRAGYSQKGPQPQQASHYYSEPQLAVQATVNLAGRERRLAGRGWLDHEWSNELMPEAAVGWDWIGINLHDGGALTAFVLRRRDGSAVWAGGSHRTAAGVLRIFGPDEVRFEPQREWQSPATGARYPVRWGIRTPAGEHAVEALLDAQELDSRASSGAVYWEGLSALRDGAGREIGLGYLEMTGRSAPLRLGGG